MLAVWEGVAPPLPLPRCPRAEGWIRYDISVGTFTPPRPLRGLSMFITCRIPGVTFHIDGSMIALEKPACLTAGRKIKYKSII